MEGDTDRVMVVSSATEQLKSTAKKGGFKQFVSIVWNQVGRNRPLRIVILPVFLLMIISNWAEWQIPLYAKNVAGCFDSHDAFLFHRVIMGIALFTTLHYIVAAVYCVIFDFTLYDLRVVIMCQCTANFMEMDHDAYQKMGSGRILNKITRQVDAMVGFTTIMVKDISYNLFFFIFCACSIYSAFGKGILCVFLVSFLLVFVLALTSPMIRRYRNTHNYHGNLGYNKVIDIFNNFSMIKSYNSVGKELLALEGILGGATAAEKSYNVSILGFATLLRFVMLGTYLALLYAGFVGIGVAAMSVDNVILLHAVFTKFKQRSMKITSLSLDLLSYYVDILHCNECMVLKRPNKDGRVLLGNNRCARTIQFKNVSISQNNTKLFDGLNLVISPGDKIAVTGCNGSGKSTILKALMGFSKYQGELLMDGVQISSINEKFLHGLVAYVPQEPYLMNTTLINNLKYGAPDMANDDVVKACMMCNMHQVFANLPLGYQTPVGENHCEISGGQAQLINFMRAVIKDSSIIVLDEPTSNLDYTTSQQLIDCIFTHLQDKTIILSTHNPHQLARFDKIINIHNKSITVFDSAEDFIATTGLSSFL